MRLEASPHFELLSVLGLELFRARGGLEGADPLERPLAVQVLAEVSAIGGERRDVPRDRDELAPQTQPPLLERIEHPLRRPHAGGLVSVDAAYAHDDGTRLDAA